MPCLQDFLSLKYFSLSNTKLIQILSRRGLCELLCRVLWVPGAPQDCSLCAGYATLFPCQCLPWRIVFCSFSSVRPAEFLSFWLTPASALFALPFLQVSATSSSSLWLSSHIQTSQASHWSPHARPAGFHLNYFTVLHRPCRNLWINSLLQSSLERLRPHKLHTFSPNHTVPPCLSGCACSRTHFYRLPVVGFPTVLHPASPVVGS